ncbi:MAG: ATP-dependent DNA helicase [Euryarchaeota archaeon]|nr:ATP-dependent DNA helicase [Euryarchaeota archaeon]
MNICDLPLPENLILNYKAKNITELYPPQADCVNAGLFSGKNLLISIPTASGKTLVAEMAMHHNICKDGKCLYIVPLKALASEKYEEFQGKGVEIGIATGDLDRRDNYLSKNDIIIATSEKVDSLLRNNAGWLSEISLLIVDEAHLIDSENRGPTLEMVITKLKCLNAGIQVLALTATIGNPKVLAGWLDAELVSSKWRPVDLREAVYCRGTLHFSDEKKEIKTPTKYDDTNLCIDTINDSGQCLVFVASRKNAEGFAKRAAPAIKEESPELDKISNQLEDVADTDMGHTLARCVKKGVAFHHAGMKRLQRKFVEDGFRDRHIKVISSTPTLAAGLNLPARRVIIRDYLRFKSGAGMLPIPVREYRQMAGRAGRPALDPFGEALLIAKNNEAVRSLYEEYIDAPAEDVKSHCDDEYTLGTHILSLIATGFVSSEDELISFMEKTFYVFQNKKTKYLSRIIKKSIDFLKTSAMISDTDQKLSANNYGQLISRLYINPYSADMISFNLSEHNSEDGFSEIGLLHMLCMTHDMYTLYVRKNDLHFLEKFLYDHDKEFWIECSYDEMEEFYRALKTAMLLSDWIDEVGEETICDRYNVGPGDIYNAVDGVNWLLHSATRLSEIVAPGLKIPVLEMELRMKHGIKRNLLPLVKLHGIGRVRARRLFNNNITTPEMLREAGIDKVSSIVGQGIARNLFRQIEGKSQGKNLDNINGNTEFTDSKKSKDSKNRKNSKKAKTGANPKNNEKQSNEKQSSLFQFR